MIIVGQHQEILGRWICEKTKATYIPDAEQYIGLVGENGKIKAVTAYGQFNGASVMVHVAIEGRLTRDFIRLCYDYPFNQLGVYKLVGLVSSLNEKALKFDLHSGWVEECVIKGGVVGGDLHILTMTREQCKFIK